MKTSGLPRDPENIMINRLLTVDGSWLVAQGSGLVAKGGWPAPRLGSAPPSGPGWVAGWQARVCRLCPFLSSPASSPSSSSSCALPSHSFMECLIVYGKCCWISLHQFPHIPLLNPYQKSRANAPGASWANSFKLPD